MKNTKRILRASEAEKIRSILEETYLTLYEDKLIMEDDIRDDPSDYYRYEESLPKVEKRMNQIEQAIELVGGFGENMYSKAHQNAFGW